VLRLLGACACARRPSSPSKRHPVAIDGRAAVCPARRSSCCGYEEDSDRGERRVAHCDSGGNCISSFSVNWGLLILGRRLGIWQSTQGLRC